jgi:hypothetical protein
LGLSIEYWALENYAGKDPRAVDPVLVQLIRNLVPGQTAVLRIGGVTTDTTWWPVAGVPRPPGAYYTLTRRRLEVANALAQAADARLILGVQFEADSLVEAAAESRAMLTVIPRGRIAGFELGNEPELYGFLSWYKRDGVDHLGRPRGWPFTSFVNDFARVAAAVGRGSVAGPVIGSFSWMAYLDQFLAARPGLSLVTLHRYPLQGCSVAPSGPTYPTIANLLSDSASTGLAANLAPYVAIAHAHGLPVRNDEMNTVSCGDAAYGVSDTFASALWALDALFEMAKIGVDGVNIHTYPGYADQLFTVKRVNSRWQAVVAPEYYGLLMFAQAAPAGSQLLQVSGASSTNGLRAWATQARDGRIRVVLINYDVAHPKTLAVRVNATPAAATLERLQAPSVRSTQGVTLGAKTFGPQTTTGVLSAPLQTVQLATTAGAYLVRLPAASAAMLTLG